MDNRPPYYRSLEFFELAVHEEFAWFCNVTYCALFRMNLNSFEIEFETFLPSDSEEEFFQYAAMAYFDNRLIIAPYNAKNVLVYDLYTKQIKKIEIDLGKYSLKQVQDLFINVYIYQDAAYLFPGRYPAIVRINLHTYEVKYIEEWYCDLSCSITKSDKLIFLRNYFKEDDICILPCWQNENVLEINLGTGEFEVFSLKDGDKALSDVVYESVIYEDGIYWFSVKNEARVIRYDKLHGFWSSVLLPADIELSDGSLYLINLGRYIYGIPFCGNMIIQIDKLSSTSTKFEVMDFSHKMEHQEMPQKYISYCRRINSNEAVLFSLLEEKIFKIDFDKRSVTEYKLRLAEKDESALERHMKQLYWKCLNIHYEQEQDSLTDLISYICHNEQDRLPECH